jgi:hypothetical protein
MEKETTLIFNNPYPRDDAFDILAGIYGIKGHTARSLMTSFEALEEFLKLPKWTWIIFFRDEDGVKFTGYAGGNHYLEESPEQMVVLIDNYFIREILANAPRGQSNDALM